MANSLTKLKSIFFWKRNGLTLARQIICLLIHIALGFETIVLFEEYYSFYFTVLADALSRTQQTPTPQATHLSIQASSKQQVTTSSFEE